MLFRDSKLQDVVSFPSAFSSYIPRSRKVYGCILISPNDRILLVRGRLSGKWSLPKGHMEGRENDIQCALRELFEETGVTPTIKYTYYKKFAAGGYFIFFMNNEPPPHIQCDTEITETAWFGLTEIRNLSCNLDLNCFCRWMKRTPLRSDDLNYLMIESKSQSNNDMIVDTDTLD